MKSHSVLMIVERPKDSDIAREREWLELSKASQGVVAKASGIETLGENIWLIPLQNKLQTLGSLMHLADHYRLVYRFLFFEDKPEWVRSQPLPA